MLRVSNVRSMPPPRWTPAPLPQEQVLNPRYRPWSTRLASTPSPGRCEVSSFFVGEEPARRAAARAVPARARVRLPRLGARLRLAGAVRLRAVGRGRGGACRVRGRLNLSAIPIYLASISLVLGAAL